VAQDAGFEVQRVDVRGVENMNELKIYERVLAERDRAMPLVDLEALRGELLELPWVSDARVSRQLPNTLVVDVVERKPHAVLRKGGNKLVLIDPEGTELEPISEANSRGKLVVSGPGAGQRVAALTSLLEAAPALKPQVREARWVGNRRWDLTFKTDQVLALPEGEREAAGALVSFARLDGTNRLLGGKVVAFDMRAGDRIYLRVPGREGQPEALDAGATRTKKEGE
jgi:cell division protein FtsQ